MAAKHWLIYALFSFTGLLQAQGLQTSYDQRGLTNLSYNGVSLINLNAGLGDAFYVGSYSLNGTGAWGGIGDTANWNASSQTLTWSWTWGSVACQFATPTGTNNLSVTCKVVNSSSQTLNGIDIFPFGLQFPSLPTEFGNASYPQFHNNLDAPSIIPADYGTGMLTLVDNDARPLVLGFSPSGAANHYALQMGTNNDSSEGFLATALPVNRPIAPGQSDTYSFSLRFSPSGTNYHTVTADFFAAYSAAWPQTLNWTDRRPIGELFMTNPTSTPIASSSPNPRNYTVAQNINIQTAAGLTAFQQAVMAYAQNSVQILKNMNAQGAIVWDLEGQQYPQPNTSYVGDPTQLPNMSPEMNSIANQFFATFTSNGLKCGMTLRTETLDFTVSPPNQDTVPVGTEASVLINKIQYAYNRWGCTIYYVDSDGGPDNATAPAMFQQVMAALPQVLIIPENIWEKDSAYTAPLASFTAPYKPLHTTADDLKLWPNAFTVTYIGDAPNDSLSNNPSDANQWNEFVSAVAGGDILSFRGWFDDEPLNSQVTQIYQAAATLKASQQPSAPVTPQVLTITPATAAATGSQQEQFTANLGGTATQAVTWSISPAGMGTISASGLYTAPALITAQQTVTVTATSTANPAQSASAAVTLNPAVSVTVTPATGSLTSGQTLPLTATVSGSTNQGVTWAIAPAGVGSISVAGLYTAPASILAPETMVATATSAADTTKTGSSTISLNPTVAATCPAPSTNAFTGCYYLDETFGTTLGLGFSRVDPQINFNWGTSGAGSGVGPNDFSVRWQGNFTFAAGAYTFTLTTDDGSILYIDGNQVINDWSAHPATTYTQAVTLTAGTHVIRVDYFQAGGGASASLSWTNVVPLVSVAVTPATGTVAAAQTLQLTATVTGSTNSQVNWTISPAGQGTISSTGLYTAPSSPTSQETVIVTATSTASSSASASATLTVTPPVIASNSCPAPSTNAFTGCYYLDQTFGTTRGLGFTRVDSQINFNWGTSGAGSGVGPNNFSVRWQGNFTFAAGTYVFSLSTDDGSILYIDGSPVISDWTDHGAYLISQPVVLTAGTHLIDLDYYQDGGAAAASLSWTTPAIGVTVTPYSVGMLSAGHTLQLAAEVTGTTNSQVSWTVSPAGLGTVSASGLYTAPSSVNGQETVTVTATSAAASTKSSSSSITLSPTPGLAACPAPATGAFTGCYYLDQTFGTTGGLAFSRTDSAINFNWTTGPGNGVGQNNFSARWQGNFTFTAGTYNFTFASDDGSMLYIDGQPVANEWGDHGVYTTVQPVVMTAGQHLIQLDYFQASGGAYAALSWAHQ